MKKILTIGLLSLFSLPTFAQEEEDSDTTRIYTKTKEIIIIDFDDSTDDLEKKKRSEAHWAGVDFGVSMLMNSSFKTDFPNDPHWENDAAKSTVWNLNVAEYKFQVAKHYFGITTGLGFNFTSVGLKNNYVLVDSPDSLYAFRDTVNNFTKNKLKAAYLTIPLLLEFNTNADEDKNFYLAAGVVGGLRLTSKTKRKGELNGNKFTDKDKGTYSLNPFKLDAAVRLGYGHFGVFANYSLLPLFDTGKTTEVYPLTFGLSLNF